MNPSVPPPGWYPDPAGTAQRYWDGNQWTAVAPLTPVNAPASIPPSAAGVVITGPNHALHFILTLFTFWACGGWAWVWLVIALNNPRKVQTVDAYGRPIIAPSTPRPPTPPFFWFTALSTRDRVLVVGIGAIFALYLLFIVVHVLM